VKESFDVAPTLDQFLWPNQELSPLFSTTFASACFHSRPLCRYNLAMGIYVGLIACPDRAGLVHQITGVMFRRRLNVTENQEFVDHRSGHFFMRTQFEGSADIREITDELRGVIPHSFICQIRELKPRRLVIMASRELHCLGDLLVRHSTGELKAEILAVLSQFEDSGDLVRRFDIPFQCIPYHKDRQEHEQRIWETLEPLKPDYLVLARYMRIFSQSFVHKMPQRILNIHHSFLPAFIGKDPYQQAYERGVKIVGATSHFVIEDLDQGPIITQDIIAVDHTCSPEQMARKGQDVEKIVLSRGLNLVLEDRVLIDGNRTVVFAN
jgi:formyltetrahydrofolate deformylase